MNEEKYKVYKVELTQEEIRELINLCEFSFEKIRPFVPMTLINIEDRLRKIILHGCFKHNRLCVRFQTDLRRSEVICPQCYPKEYKKLKEKYTEEEA